VIERHIGQNQMQTIASSSKRAGAMPELSGPIPTHDRSKDSGAPDVSVVIPTLNRWSELARLGLRAALSQQEVSVEAIVVDDGSDTPSPDSPPFDDPRVRLIRHETNLGVAAARNTGIGAARGSWIAFLDDDDIWAPTKLVSVIGAVDRAGADFGYSSVIVVDSGLTPIRVMPAAPSRGLHEALLRRSVIPSGASNVVAKVSLLSQAGEFDPELSTAADWEMWLRLAKAGRAEAVNEPLVAYRSSSWIIEDEPRHRLDCERMAAKHPEVTVDWLVHERWVADSFWRNGQRVAGLRKHAVAWLRHGDLRSLAKAGTSLLSGRRRDLARMARMDPASDWIRLYA
jgi:glycosyltransferase involved in cell wall biosynthesis